MPTQSDIAKQLGISVSAVSAAFCRPQFVSAELRANILKTAQEMGYRRNTSATPRIAVIVPNLRHFFYGPFYQDILFGILAKSTELKTEIRIFEGYPESHSDIYDVDAILVVGKLDTKSNQLLQGRSIPVLSEIGRAHV